MKTISEFSFCPLAYCKTLKIFNKYNKLCLFAMEKKSQFLYFFSFCAFSFVNIQMIFCVGNNNVHHAQSKSK